ncbi:germination lipoprotein GerS [Terrisporobacter sp.]
MKNKWCILSISFILIISACMVGCMNRGYTKEDVYEDFKNQVSSISSYTCIAKVEAIGNKENTTYVFKHTYKKPGYYKLEVKSPENMKGKIIEYKGDKVLVHNPNINDIIELPNKNDDSHYLFIGDFIQNYMEDESAKLETVDNELKIETEIPGDNKYFNKQILYVNNKTKNPDKMEILNSEGEVIFIVTYENFKYKN